MRALGAASAWPRLWPKVGKAFRRNASTGIHKKKDTPGVLIALWTPFPCDPESF